MDLRTAVKRNTLKQVQEIAQNTQGIQEDEPLKSSVKDEKDSFESNASMKESASKEYTDGKEIAGRSVDKPRAQVQAQSEEFPLPGLPHTEDKSSLQSSLKFSASAIDGSYPPPDIPPFQSAKKDRDGSQTFNILGAHYDPWQYPKKLFYPGIKDPDGWTLPSMQCEHSDSYLMQSAEMRECANPAAIAKEITDKFEPDVIETLGATSIVQKSRKMNTYSDQQLQRQKLDGRDWFNIAESKTMWNKINRESMAREWKEFIKQQDAIKFDWSGSDDCYLRNHPHTSTDRRVAFRYTSKEARTVVLPLRQVDVLGPSDPNYVVRALGRDEQLKMLRRLARRITRPRATKRFGNVVDFGDALAHLATFTFLNSKAQEALDAACEGRPVTPYAQMLAEVTTEAILPDLKNSSEESKGNNVSGQSLKMSLQERLATVREKSIFTEPAPEPLVPLDRKKQLQCLRKLVRKMVESDKNRGELDGPQQDFIPEERLAQLSMFTFCINMGLPQLAAACTDAENALRAKKMREDKARAAATAHYAKDAEKLSDSDSDSDGESDDMDEEIIALENKSVVPFKDAIASVSATDIDPLQADSPHLKAVIKNTRETCGFFAIGSKGKNGGKGGDWWRRQLYRRKKGHKPELQEFIDSHNDNVNKMADLLDNPFKASYTKYPALSKTKCMARLASDNLLLAATKQRMVVERELCRLKAKHFEDEVSDVIESVEEEGYSKLHPRKLKSKWLKDRIDSMRQAVDRRNESRVERSNRNRERKLIRDADRTGMPTEEEVLKELNECKKRKKYFWGKPFQNSKKSIAPHGRRFGLWHFGKANKFTGNICALPTNGGSQPEVGEMAITVKSALQYAFLGCDFHAKDFPLQHRMNATENEGCRAKFNFFKKKVSLSCSKGNSTKRVVVDIVPELVTAANEHVDTDIKETLSFRWSHKGSIYLDRTDDDDDDDDNGQTKGDYVSPPVAPGSPRSNAEQLSEAELEQAREEKLEAEEDESAKLGEFAIEVDGHSSYEGRVNHLGQRHGFGFARYKNGGTYKGPWFKGKRQGRCGEQTHPDGSKYRGEWLADREHGQGECINPQGEVEYRGEFLEGLKLEDYKAELRRKEKAQQLLEQRTQREAAAERRSVLKGMHMLNRFYA